MFVDAGTPFVIVGYITVLYVRAYQTNLAGSENTLKKFMAKILSSDIKAFICYVANLAAPVQVEPRSSTLIIIVAFVGQSASANPVFMNICALTTLASL